MYTVYMYNNNGVCLVSYRDSLPSLLNGLVFLGQLILDGSLQQWAQSTSDYSHQLATLVLHYRAIGLGWGVKGV